MNTMDSLNLTNELLMIYPSDMLKNLSNNSDTKVVHFKIYNGGHQWFGSPVGDWFLIKLFLGKNNHEIN